MKMHVINLAERGLRQVGKRLYGAKITVMGLAYKKNINDPRESPAIKIIEELVPWSRGACVRPPCCFTSDEGGHIHFGEECGGNARRSRLRHILS